MMHHHHPYYLLAKIGLLAGATLLAMTHNPSPASTQPLRARPIITIGR